MGDTPRINGTEYSSSSIKCVIADEPIYGWTAINFAAKLEVVQTYAPAAGQGPQGDTAGKYVPEPIKLSGYARTIQALRAQLAALSPTGTSYGSTRFGVVVNFFEEDSDADPITIEFGGCRFIGESTPIAEGPEGIIEEIEIMVRTCKRNGLTLYRDVEGAA